MLYSDLNPQELKAINKLMKKYKEAEKNKTLNEEESFDVFVNRYGLYDEAELLMPKIQIAHEGEEWCFIWREGGNIMHVK
jgi:hypothetical protein